MCVCDNLLSFSCKDLYVNIDRNYQNLDTPDKFNQQTPNPINSSKAISELPQDTS
jgi:hypothetical protein